MGLNTPITENILPYVRQLNTLQPFFSFLFFFKGNTNEKLWKTVVFLTVKIWKVTY